MPDNNIEIREDSNPIIFVNKPFILEIEIAFSEKRPTQYT